MRGNNFNRPMRPYGIRGMGPRPGPLGAYCNDRGERGRGGGPPGGYPRTPFYAGYSANMAMGGVPMNQASGMVPFAQQSAASQAERLKKVHDLSVVILKYKEKSNN